jgi:hypothetical protein
MLILTVVSFGSHFAKAEDVPEKVSRLHAAVTKDADWILKLAYPSATRMTAAPSGTYRARLAGGYTIDEKFNYTDSDGAGQSFTLTLKLDQDGKLTSVSELERSELWPTFGTGNLLLAAAKAIARDQVDEARRHDQEPPRAALLILQADDITDLVVIKLNFDR